MLSTTILQDSHKKNLCWSLFYKKAAGLKPAILLKKRLGHSCFPQNFAKIFRTLFFGKYLQVVASLIQCLQCVLALSPINLLVDGQHWLVKSASSVKTFGPVRSSYFLH